MAPWQFDNAKLKLKKLDSQYFIYVITYRTEKTKLDENERNPRERMLWLNGVTFVNTEPEFLDI